MRRILLVLALLLIPAGGFAAPKVPQEILKFLHSNPTTHKISAVSFLKRLGSEEKITLIDVRTPQEFAVMHINGAINIPYDQLAEHLDQIPHDGLVVAYCHSGRRAEGATTVLHILGYDNVVNLGGGLKALTPAITAKSAPALDFKKNQTPVDTSPADDTDDDEEDMGC
ncbi:rhodanese-like domain-containing protein [Geothermobacter hydrogeniphilus]|uniref:Rhodanese domain-containing protein n=1 Tax=Geothermobacter hydrogeniphilus TaxID=1969733 RepID=A0A1X0Y2E6_9BACT|nr:rhodanese-like domain-containing protein [Geothermobacter hydrogeniphilus]ORJ59333.1 hypothetical protein B5V00_10595 [Geothermobacter hydrogeniphilus]